MDESALLAAARHGCRASFNELIRAHQDMVYGVAYRLLGCSDAAGAVTQSAFLAAFRALRGYRGASFRAWLLRQAVEACARQPRQPAPDFAGRDTGKERQGQRDAALQESIAVLPWEQRLALVLVDAQGLSYGEAAEVLGIAQTALCERLAKARLNLRDSLAARWRPGPALASAKR
jgi:RNA polymerase sigma-70 factor, ECF subfamily